ncbi:hypothetical protein SADUNF_Sadunf08G0102500 [Salix dunnii]|uniref:Uncharacterized protein n=1 Tax=Salix dunnii TaxID=1413687 RepID=A0A835MUP3_9ROSI|nr:hypothetical protein SADUNF_Sadunf08G0102500 [Salix dunnii]
MVPNFFSAYDEPVSKEGSDLKTDSSVSACLSDEVKEWNRKFTMLLLDEGEGGVDFKRGMPTFVCPLVGKTICMAHVSSGLSTDDGLFEQTEPLASSKAVTEKISVAEKYAVVHLILTDMELCHVPIAIPTHLFRLAFIADNLFHIRCFAQDNDRAKRKVYNIQTHNHFLQVYAGPDLRYANSSSSRISLDDASFSFKHRHSLVEDSLSGRKKYETIAFIVSSRKQREKEQGMGAILSAHLCTSKLFLSRLHLGSGTLPIGMQVVVAIVKWETNDATKIQLAETAKSQFSGPPNTCLSHGKMLQVIFLVMRAAGKIHSLKAIDSLRKGSSPCSKILALLIATQPSAIHYLLFAGAASLHVVVQTCSTFVELGLVRPVTDEACSKSHSNCSEHDCPTLKLPSETSTNFC